MSALPSMPLYVDDFEADTAHLTLQEDGAYNRLLRLCWRSPTCSIPDDQAWISRRLRVSDAEYQAVVSPVLSEFFTRENGMIWQKRQRQEYTYTKSMVEARKAAGSIGGKTKALKRKDIEPSNATDLLDVCYKQNSSKTLAPKAKPKPKSNTSFERDFSTFWEAVPVKVGRAVAEKAYAKAASQNDPALILSAMKTYAASRLGQDPKFTAHPATWLNAGRWADEAPKAAKPSTPIEGARMVRKSDGAEMVYTPYDGWVRFHG